MPLHTAHCILVLLVSMYAQSSLVLGVFAFRELSYPAQSKKTIVTMECSYIQLCYFGLTNEEAHGHDTNTNEMKLVEMKNLIDVTR